MKIPTNEPWPLLFSVILDETEVKGARKVLSAAAMTYVAAAAASILQFLRLLAIANSRRD